MEAHGWRAACLGYAALHLAVCLPLRLLVVPHTAPDGPPAVVPAPPQASGGAAAPEGPSADLTPPPAVFARLAALLILMGLISSVVSVHLLAPLDLRGLDAAAAVALGALIGPAQVAARLLDALVGRRLHPISTMTAFVALNAVGLAVLLVDAPGAALAVVFYGAGNGLHTIVRGALPLALFGPERFAVATGRLARPSLVVQALAPSASAWLLLGDGTLMLAVLTALGLGGLGLCWEFHRSVR